MRKLISIFLILPFFANAQNTLIEYSEIWGTSVLNSLLHINQDKSLYIEIGKSSNNPSSEEVFSNDFKIKDIGFLIQKENDKFYLTELAPSLRNQMTEDVAPKINWKLLAETKEILGHQCKKAEGEFRGRKVFAYFAPQIPLSAGPWKYAGLPGLILEAWDNDEKFRYIAKRILLNTNLEVPNHLSIYIADLKTKMIPFKDFINKENEFKKKTIEMIAASMPENSFFTSDDLRENSRELQFEWEKEPLKIQSSKLINAEQKQMINAINNK